MGYVILLAGAFCTIVAFLHFSSILTVVSRLHNANAPASMRDDVGGVIILRPVCGIENFIEETLQTTFRLDYPHYEVVFCAAYSQADGTEKFWRRRHLRKFFGYPTHA